MNWVIVKIVTDAGIHGVGDATVERRELAAFGVAWQQMHRSERNKTLAEVAAVRRIAGEDVDILIEGHGRLDVPTAVIFGNALAEFDPLFFEEPIPPENIDALADIRSRIPIP